MESFPVTAEKRERRRVTNANGNGWRIFMYTVNTYILNNLEIYRPQVRTTSLLLTRVGNGMDDGLISTTRFKFSFSLRNEQRVIWQLKLQTHFINKKITQTFEELVFSCEWSNLDKCSNFKLTLRFPRFVMGSKITVYLQIDDDWYPSDLFWL